MESSSANVTFAQHGVVLQDGGLTSTIPCAMPTYALNRVQVMAWPYGVYPNMPATAPQWFSPQHQQVPMMVSIATESGMVSGYPIHQMQQVAVDPEYFRQQQQQAYFYHQQQAAMYPNMGMQQAAVFAPGYGPVPFSQGCPMPTPQFCAVASPHFVRPMTHPQYGGSAPALNAQQQPPQTGPDSQSLSMFEAPLPSAAYTADWVSSTSNIPQDLKDPPDAGDPLNGGNNDSDSGQGKSGPDTSVNDDLDAGASAVSGDSPVMPQLKEDENTFIKEQTAHQWPDLSVSLTEVHRERHAFQLRRPNNDESPQRSWEDRIKRNALLKERNEYRGEQSDRLPRGRRGAGGGGGGAGRSWEIASEQQLNELNRNMILNMASARASVPIRAADYALQAAQTAVLSNGATILYDPTTPVGVQIKFAQYHHATTGQYPLPAATALQQDEKFRATWLDIHLPIPTAPAFHLGPQPDPMQLSSLLDAMGLEMPSGQSIVVRKGRRLPRIRHQRTHNVARSKGRRNETVEEESELADGERADDGLGEEVDSTDAEGEETPREEKTEEEDEGPDTPTHETSAEKVVVPT